MIKVRDVAYVRFAAPDLEVMERFLTDFGLVVHSREGGSTRPRSTTRRPPPSTLRPRPATKRRLE